MVCRVSRPQKGGMSGFSVRNQAVGVEGAARAEREQDLKRDLGVGLRGLEPQVESAFHRGDFKGHGQPLEYGNVALSHDG